MLTSFKKLHESRRDYVSNCDTTYISSEYGKKAIGTFKDHFIAGLSSVDSKTPMNLLCRLAPQGLLILHDESVRINIKLSA